MRKPLIAGNWKMNKTPSEAKELLGEILKETLDTEVEACVCVPAVDLSVACECLSNSDIQVGAQNFYFEKSGAYTGEISAPMLLDLGVRYVIIGHSERREYFSETDELIQKKVKSALEQGLDPILCVGETLEERENNLAFSKVEKQIIADLNDINSADFGRIVVAYEPIWAIGTGKTASADDAQDMCAFIRETIAKQFGKECAEAVRIQYGGSVKPSNVKEIMEKQDIDGALVGGASLQSADFVKLVNYRK